MGSTPSSQPVSPRLGVGGVFIVGALGAVALGVCMSGGCVSTTLPEPEPRPARACVRGTAGTPEYVLFQEVGPDHCVTLWLAPDFSGMGGGPDASGALRLSGLRQVPSVFGVGMSCDAALEHVLFELPVRSVDVMGGFVELIFEPGESDETSTLALSASIRLTEVESGTEATIRVEDFVLRAPAEGIAPVNCVGRE